MAERHFSSTAQRTTLSGSVSDSTTTIVVASVSGFPSSRPYSLILDLDTVDEEIVEVTAQSGTTLTVTRGVDGTTAVAHDINAVVCHGMTGRDLGEPQAHIYASEAVHGVEGDVVGTEGTQTLTDKSMSGTDNTFSNIPQSAITGLVAGLAAKAPIASPTFTGTVILPADTSIGDVGATELSYINGATSNIQAQLDAIDTTTDDLQTQIDVIVNDGGTGQTLPAGGVDGDVLVKQSSTDGDAAWEAPSGLGIPPGGVLGQALIKLSDDDYDVGWGYVAAVVPADADIIDDSAMTTPLGNDGTGTYTDGGATYRWYRFTTPETAFSFVNSQPVIGKLLMVAGAGAGGNNSLSYGGGGGGAGAYFYGDYAFGVGNHRVLVGHGGTNAEQVGGESIFDNYVAYGGGKGGNRGNDGGPGGSGGGGGDDGVHNGGAALHGSTDNRVNQSLAFLGSDGATGAPGDGGGPNGTTGITLALDGVSRTYAKGGIGGGSNTATSDPAANTGSGADGEPPGVYGGTGAGRSGADGIVIVRVRIA